jgi:ribonuclease-3
MDVSSSENISLLESRIRYRFRRKSLITEALTHKSFAKEKSGDPDLFNERLEFLGDAVLGLIISHHLFRHYPAYTEAQLSKVKAYAVQEATLAEIASDLGLGAHLFLGKGENASGGRKKVSLLANAFEAILGAVYLDGGMKNARDLVLRCLDHKIKTLIEKNLLYDYKTRFQEIAQERQGVLPVYKTQREEGPEHMKTFEVKVFIGDRLYGSGKGRSKKEAAQNAARSGLKKLLKE